MLSGGLDGSVRRFRRVDSVDEGCPVESGSIKLSSENELIEKWGLVDKGMPVGHLAIQVAYISRTGMSAESKT